MRKRPPKNNVRRVHPFGNNTRFEFITKDGAVAQAESFGERIEALTFERDKTVLRYGSQPLLIPYDPENEAGRKYPPDFLVERVDGAIEIYEVTLSSRRKKESAQLREAAATRYCQERGWKYFVDTEKTLPDSTEANNLYMLYGFSARAFCKQQVREILLRDLELGKKWRITAVVEQLAKNIGIHKGCVVSTILWMIWHCELETDMSMLLVIEGEPNKKAMIWRKENDK
jgi:hypothetical protein